MPATKKKTTKKPAPKAAVPQSAESPQSLVDEAAALLRKGIPTGADAGDKARALLGLASSSLSGALDEGACLMKKAINKIG